MPRKTRTVHIRKDKIPVDRELLDEKTQAGVWRECVSCGDLFSATVRPELIGHLDEEAAALEMPIRDREARFCGSTCEQWTQVAYIKGIRTEIDGGLWSWKMASGQWRICPCCGDVFSATYYPRREIPSADEEAKELGMPVQVSWADFCCELCETSYNGMKRRLRDEKILHLPINQDLQEESLDLVVRKLVAKHWQICAWCLKVFSVDKRQWRDGVSGEREGDPIALRHEMPIGNSQAEFCDLSCFEAYNNEPKRRKSKGKRKTRSRPQWVSDYLVLLVK